MAVGSEVKIGRSTDRGTPYRHGNIIHTRWYPHESASNLTGKIQFEFGFGFSPIIKYRDGSIIGTLVPTMNSSPNLPRLIYYDFIILVLITYNIKYVINVLIF